MLPQASQHPATRPGRVLIALSPQKIPSSKTPPPSLASPHHPVRNPRTEVQGASQSSPQAAGVQVPQPEQCSHCSYSFVLSLSLFGLAWAPACTLLHWDLSRSHLAPHRTSTGTSTPTATTAAATTTAALCYAPLGDPSIFLLRVVPPSLLLFQSLFHPHFLDPKHPTLPHLRSSILGFLIILRPPDSVQLFETLYPSPSTRRNRSTLSSTSSPFWLRSVSWTRSSRSQFENFSTSRRLQHTLVTFWLHRPGFGATAVTGNPICLGHFSTLRRPVLCEPDSTIPPSPISPDFVEIPRLDYTPLANG
ncbi:hypothetical protein BDP55DRAFT_169928 [Colletotrichum godetiae]|uniref:Uncharacterized protein n=1 Tax=Colletotrichum godetiae TaxID=1209918 RepID=A0AAJ0ET69_9PEZI|nr:uncharacterized protein BDP55DRAFT_169928 [Colletotrichum godetiae]KAK1674707.1 hypothetical protein BDP55DRAFT_169928 [Colletotrichum godetiae]